MRKIDLLFVIVFLLLPSISLAVDAKDKQASTDSDLCVAYVKDNTAFFLFPIEEDSRWIWFQNTTKDNALEYSWEIVINNPKNSYKFGCFLYKFPGQKQKEGSLRELLSDAQISVYDSVLRPNGGTIGTLRDDLNIRAGIIDKGVVVGIKDSKTFATILKDKPKTAKFVIRDPVEDNFSCNVTIKYY